MCGKGHATGTTGSTDILHMIGTGMKTTFPQLLLKHAAERPAAAALREKEYGIWQAHSWAALAALVEQVAAGLHLAGLRRSTPASARPPC